LLAIQKSVLSSFQRLGKTFLISRIHNNNLPFTGNFAGNNSRMALQPWTKGIVTKIENETSNTRRFWIEVPEMKSFDFIPGQFVTLDLPIHEKPTRRWRSYSIASWPDNTNIFELLIVLDRKGLGTPYLFNEIKPGSELIFRGPQGIFVLKEPLDKDLFFICTGTGVAPFRSM
jgi:CDP-4-dehydro-6-deoxyglucose reductase